jgi:cobaltochelatase CobT
LLADLAGPLLLVGFVIAGFAIRTARRRRGPRPVRDGPPDEPYNIYTTAFDLTLHAAEIPNRLASASPDLQHGRLHMNDRAWETAMSASIAMQAQLAGLGDESLERWRRASSAIAPAEIVLSLLIDQSGSMNGEPIAAAAATAAWLSDLVCRFGARIEILGFSTAGWQGGHAYAQWLRSGCPKRPGRLCVLMHLIYKEAGETGLRPDARRAMLHPDLLRENVDGEALRWAAQRLSSHPQPYKLLILISDGAPVDDATLLHNGLSYLQRDLVASVRRLNDEGAIVVGAVGLDRRADDVFKFSTFADNPSALPLATAELVEAFITNAAKQRVRSAP